MACSSGFAECHGASPETGPPKYHQDLHSLPRDGFGRSSLCKGNLAVLWKSLKLARDDPKRIL